MNKILVTGGSGLVGKYLQELMPNAHFVSSKDFDLTKEKEVKTLFNKYHPNTVIHLAAKVAGIQTNIAFPTEYLEENILMNTFMLKYAHLNDVERFIGMISTCAYPDKVDHYPMEETDLLNGPPSVTNLSYAYAKRIMAIQIENYNKQYGKYWNYLIPCNLYGEYDEFDEFKSHMVSALIKKIYEADDSINLLGSGKPFRQFMYAKDLARVIKIIIDKDIYNSLNVSPPENFTISDIAKIGIKACDKEYLEINWDSSKPDGQFRKDVTSKNLMNVLPEFTFTSLEEGIRWTYTYYKQNLAGENK
jgi:GDP-L-fucose synthase